MVLVASFTALVPGADAASPDLPPLSPTELVQKARTSEVSTLSGTVQLTTNLGLPPLDYAGDGSMSALTSLQGGAHEAQVWIDGSEHVRVALPAELSETSWIVNGTDVWSWDSYSQRVVHVTLPDHEHAEDQHAEDRVRGGADPAALAQELLDAVTPSTEVTVRSPRYVAGRAAYELALDPRTGASTIGDVAISIDAENGMPLEVRISAADGTVAAQLGFTSISYEQPDPATFAFTPPPGATVEEAADPSALSRPGVPYHHRRQRDDTAADAGVPAPDSSLEAKRQSGTEVIGDAWDAVAVVSDVSIPDELRSLLEDAPRVDVAGTGARLVNTRLVNVLVLDDGRMAFGAVTPEALQSAVAAHGS